MKTLIVAATAAFLASAGSAAAYTAVTVTDLNMREGPGTGYRIITTLPANAPVEVYGCAGWCEVEFGGAVGYVSGNYIARPTGSIDSGPTVIYRGPRYEPDVYVEPYLYEEPGYDYYDEGYDDGYGYYEYDDYSRYEPAPPVSAQPPSGPRIRSAPAARIEEPNVAAEMPRSDRRREVVRDGGSAARNSM